MVSKVLYNVCDIFPSTDYTVPSITITLACRSPSRTKRLATDLTKEKENERKTKKTATQIHPRPSAFLTNQRFFERVVDTFYELKKEKEKTSFHLNTVTI